MCHATNLKRFILKKKNLWNLKTGRVFQFWLKRLAFLYYLSRFNFCFSFSQLKSGRWTGQVFSFFLSLSLFLTRTFLKNSRVRTKKSRPFTKKLGTLVLERFKAQHDSTWHFFHHTTDVVNQINQQTASRLWASYIRWFSLKYLSRLFSFIFFWKPVLNFAVMMKEKNACDQQKLVR